MIVKQFFIVVLHSLNGRCRTPVKEAPSDRPSGARARADLGRQAGRKSRRRDLSEVAESGRNSFIAELTGPGRCPRRIWHTPCRAPSGRPCWTSTPSIRSVCQGPARPQALPGLPRRRAQQAQQPSDRRNGRPIGPAGRRKNQVCPQMGVDWVIAEYDKLSRMVEAATVPARPRRIDSIIGDDFEFDDIHADVDLEDTSRAMRKSRTRRSSRFVNKMLLDAFSSARPTSTSSRTRTTTACASASTAYCARSPSRRSRSRTSWRRASRSCRRLDIAERRVPQDGRIKMKMSKNRAIDFRVSTCPTLFGEKIVMRILDPSQRHAGHRRARLRADPERRCT